MISGVAKRMAGQFFKAIDDELTGKAEPVAGARAGAPTSDASLVVGGQPTEPGPRIFGGSATYAAGAKADVQTLALAAAGGALLTLIGVLVGHRLARKRTSAII
jgi:hypothetical protein